MPADVMRLLSPAALKRLAGTDLEYDVEKLQQLALVVAEEQEQVVRAHLSLRVPWADAFSGKALRVVGQDSPEPSSTAPEQPRRVTERRNLLDFKPNKFNAALFPDSLSDSSIAVLADDLARNGQRVPGEVTPDGTIIDCERRWRAAKLLGWKEMDVTVVDSLTDDDVLDRVLDACTSVRHLTVREQVNVYIAVSNQLKREGGRRQGRPEKTFPKGNVYLTPGSIREAAAKRAGFTSTALAARAEAVFTRGSKAIQNRVREGSMSLSAAYDELPKRGRSEEERPDPVAHDSRDESNALQAAAPTAPQPEPSSVPDNSSSAPVEGHGGNVSANEGTPAVTIDSDITEPEPETAADGDDGPQPDHADLQPAFSDTVGDNLEADSPDTIHDEPDINVHVSAVCRYLSELAELNYDDGVAWFDQVVDDLRGSLGDPPESDDEPFDE